MVDGAEQLADVAIECMPVDSAAQLRNIVNKITAFGANTGWEWSTETLAETEVRRVGDALRAGSDAPHAASPEAGELLTFEVVGDPGLVVNP